MPPTKLLFLDFDGVIRLGDDDGKNPAFNPDCLKRVIRICKETGCKIVVTSDLVAGRERRDNWTRWDLLKSIGRDVSQHFREEFDKLLFPEWTFSNTHLYIIPDERRAMMISDMLKHNPTSTYAILDDQEKLFQGPYGSRLKGALVLTNNRHGLQDSHVARVVSILGKRDETTPRRLRRRSWSPRAPRRWPSPSGTGSTSL